MTGGGWSQSHPYAYGGRSVVASVRLDVHALRRGARSAGESGESQDALDVNPTQMDFGT